MYSTISQNKPWSGLCHHVGGAYCQEQRVQREAEDLAVMKMDSEHLQPLLLTV